MEGVQLDVRIRSSPDDLMTQDADDFVPEPGTNIASSDCREWPAVLGAGFAYPIEDKDEDYLANVERLPRSLHCALAQSSGATSAGSSTGATGAGGAAGSSLSNGSTISGTGGSPGPNTAKALSRGTTGNNLGAPQTGGAGPAPSSHGNASTHPRPKAPRKVSAIPTREFLKSKRRRTVDQSRSPRFS